MQSTFPGVSEKRLDERRLTMKANKNSPDIGNVEDSQEINEMY